MKKFIVLIFLMFVTATQSFAGSTKIVKLHVHKKTSSNSQSQVNRAPMRLPIEVICDTDLQTVYVNGDDSLDAVVYLYDEIGNLEDYSSTLNAVFSIPTSGVYTINIQGEGWCAEGEVEIFKDIAVYN